jgi:hypothetical protein
MMPRFEKIMEETFSTIIDPLEEQSYFPPSFLLHSINSDVNGFAAM